jgi:hypothetical protein
MPTNCSKDLTLVIDYMDDVLEHGSACEVFALKTRFGLEALEHNDDLMAYVLLRLLKIELTFPKHA